MANTATKDGMEGELMETCPRCGNDMIRDACPACGLAICKECGQPMHGGGSGYRCPNCDSRYTRGAYPGLKSRRMI